LPNNELSPVFNIRGREQVGIYNPEQYHYYKLKDETGKYHQIQIEE
jgi:hypothetical protein